MAGNLSGLIRTCDGVKVGGKVPGAQSEIERVYRDDGARLWWSLAAFTGDRDITSDAVAEAFAQALRRGEHNLSDPRAWVWRVAFRIASGELRRRSTLSSDVPDGADPSEQPAIELMDLLSRLPISQRAAVVLHYYADLPIAEAASLMGVSTATAKVRLHRGRLTLLRLMEDDDD